MEPSRGKDKKTEATMRYTVIHSHVPVWTEDENGP